MLVISFVLALVAAPRFGVGRDRPVDLDARAWLNPASIRVPDDRTYVLFFFTTFQDKEVHPMLARLEKLNRRRGVVVVGLSAESVERIKKYVKRRKIHFPVGAGSRSYHRFGIKRFPQLVVLAFSARRFSVDWDVTDIAALERSFPALQAGDAPPFHVPESIDKNTPVEQLTQYAHNHSKEVEGFGFEQEYQEQEQREKAIRLLRSKLPAEEFMNLCDKLLQEEDDTSFFNRGFLDYQRQLADPSIKEKQPARSPAGSALRKAMREHPDDPMWQPLYDYDARMDDLPAEQLGKDFFDHLTDSYPDLAIRKDIADRLSDMAENGLGDKKAIGADLMDMLQVEPDFTIRQHIVAAISEAFEPGDLQAADSLERQLQTEENVRFVRPMMKYTIHYLRTGEE